MSEIDTSSAEFVPHARASAENDHITVVVNPGAGRGHAGRILGKVTSALLTHLPGSHLSVFQTDSYHEARFRTSEAVANAQPATDGGRGDSLIVVGGDGMAHLGLNACANSDVTLGIIPAGTGNDFCRGVGIGQNVSRALQAIIAGRTRTIDLNQVSGAIAPNRPSFIGSVVSTGYDAVVNRRTNEIHTPLGPLTYAYVALRELATFTPLQYRIEIDGVARELEAMFIAVGNAGYFGGGMNICPLADLTDGLADITIVHPVSKGKLLRMLPTMFTGRFTKDPAAELLQARQVKIDGDDMFSMADGEELGSVPLTIDVRAKALKIYVP